MEQRQPPHAQSSTLAIAYELSVLSFPTLFHSYLEETKTSDLEIVIRIQKNGKVRHSLEDTCLTTWGRVRESAFEANVILFDIAHHYVSALRNFC